jgi:hypothetical protein
MSEARSEERMTVWLNRYEEARKAGLSEEQARSYAESTHDVGELRLLVKRGCPPKLIARLVL